MTRYRIDLRSPNGTVTATEVEMNDTWLVAEVVRWRNEELADGTAARRVIDRTERVHYPTSVVARVVEIKDAA